MDLQQIQKKLEESKAPKSSNVFTIINENSNSKTAAAAVIPDFPVEQGEVTVLHDLFAGGVAGSASVIVGHPFDTIKVRMQTSTASSLEGGRQSLGSTISKFGGVSSLFRGMTAPLSAAAGVNAIIFSSYGWSTRQWDIYMPPRPSNFAQRTLSSSTTGTAITLTDSLEEENKAVHDSTQKAFMCGSFAGLTQCLIICPMEHIKCRLQIQHGRGAVDNLYSGPMSAAKDIMKKNGIRGLYRGWTVTCWRDVPAFGGYFCLYDTIKDQTNAYLARRSAAADAKLGKTNASFPHHDHRWVSSAFAGGTSGALTWLIVYPFDVIKTKIQTTPMNGAPQDQLQMWKVGRRLAAEHGWKYLFRGLGVTLVRAFPVNGIIFPMYEFSLLQVSGGFDVKD